MSSSRPPVARSGCQPGVPPAVDERFLRRVYLGIAVAVIAFTFYGSLIPFDLKHLPLGDAWTQFVAATSRSPRRISRSDFVANTLLFVPIGFALLGSRLAGRPRLSWAALLTIVVTLGIGAGVSISAEFLQTFTPQRVPSRVDISAQITGCLVGIAGWLIAGPRLTIWIQDAAKAHAREDRLVRVLTGVAAAWVFVNLAPFDLTVDLGDLARRWRTGKIALVPFAGPPQPIITRVWNFVADAASAMPLGALGLLYSRRRGRDAPALAFLFGAALVVAVECAQVFVVSHAATTVDVISGCVGVAFGVFAAGRLLEPAIAPRAHDGARMSPRAVAALVVWCIVLAAYHWAPYDFLVDRRMIDRKLARMSLLPFGGYRGSSYLNAFNDVLTKLSLAIPLGVIVAHVSRRRGSMAATVVIAWLVFASGVFGLIEAGQALLPTRTPDPTDVMLGVGGAYIGIWLARWLHSSTPHNNRET